jgi:hypothetical protein
MTAKHAAAIPNAARSPMTALDVRESALKAA